MWDYGKLITHLIREHELAYEATGKARHEQTAKTLRETEVILGWAVIAMQEHLMFYEMGDEDSRGNVDQFWIEIGETK